jgi:hypothetical protein
MNKQSADLALRQSFVTGRSSTARHAVGLRPLRARAQHNEDQRQWHEGRDDTFEKFGRLQSGSRRPGYPQPDPGAVSRAACSAKQRSSQSDARCCGYLPAGSASWPMSLMSSLFNESFPTRLDAVIHDVAQNVLRGSRPKLRKGERLG